MKGLCATLLILGLGTTAFSTQARTTVTGWLTVRGQGAGGPFKRKYRFTDVWMRRQGDWQIVAAHDYIAP